MEDEGNSKLTEQYIAAASLQDGLQDGSLVVTLLYKPPMIHGDIE